MYSVAAYAVVILRVWKAYTWSTVKLTGRRGDTGGRSSAPVAVSDVPQTSCRAVTHPFCLIFGVDVVKVGGWVKGEEKSKSGTTAKSCRMTRSEADDEQRKVTNNSRQYQSNNRLK